MTDWQTVRVFGNPSTDVRATVRPSAYGIISDGPGRLAVVRTPLGISLPGGGREAPETSKATVIRETREECGLSVRIGAWRRSAIEHVFSETEHTHFEKRNTFCDGFAIAAAGSPTEPDHSLEWVTAAAATSLLTPASHRWAVGEWLASDGAPPAGV